MIILQLCKRAVSLMKNYQNLCCSSIVCYELFEKNSQKKLQKYLVISKSRRNFAVSKTTKMMAP